MRKPHPNARALFAAVVVFSTVFWLGLVGLVYYASDRLRPGPEPWVLPAGIVAAVILTYIGLYQRRTRRAAFLRGQAVEIGPKQHPDLYVRLRSVCRRLGIESLPTAYLFVHPRFPASFSLRVQGRGLLAINAELVGALTERQGAIDFILGQELARLHDRHRRWLAFVFPALVLPALGPAYGRARTYIYDQQGLAACRSKVDAAFALAALASGSRRWKSLDIAQFAAQSVEARGFWMSLYELTAEQPWLCKRMAYLQAAATGSEIIIPRRHPLAYLVGLLIPDLGRAAPGRVLRLVLLPLWIGSAAFLAVRGTQLAAQSGLTQLVAAYWSGTAPSGRTPIPGLNATAARDPYALLRADLMALGARARELQKRQGGIPCDLGDLSSLRLHYRPSRYAFSCSAPVVYTLVGEGEFQAGQPAHMELYNWREHTFASGPPEVPAVAPPGG